MLSKDDLAKVATACRRIGPAALAAIIGPGFVAPAMAALQDESAVPEQAARPPTIREIRPGERVSSRLDPSSPSAFEDFRLNLRANDVVRINLDSPSLNGRAPAPDAPAGFDTFVEVRVPNSRSPVASNDDRRDSLNSTLIFEAPTAREYIVRVRPLRGAVPEGRDPSFTLAIEALPPAPTPTPISGDRIEGDLAQGSPITGSDSHYYASYAFDGAASERVLFELQASVSEPVLQLIGPSGTGIAADAGDAGTARIIAILPAIGRYIIRPQVPEGERAHYSVRMARAMPAPLARPQPIAVGDAVDGEFTLSANAAPRITGSSRAAFFYRLYALPVRFGQPVTVTLEATDFDPILDAGTLSVLGFQSVVSDDDSGPGESARIVINPLEDGTVYLRAHSTSLELGTFRLRTVAGTLPPEQ